jgi:hypothetical protein
MPFDPSDHLLDLKIKLYQYSTPAPTDNNPDAREIDWERASEFCFLHEAEISVIPLGLRRGWPEDIEFMELEWRLEEEWIRNELLAIARDPTTSEWFEECIQEIEEMGKLAWRSMDWQGAEKIQSRTMTG